MDWRVQAKYAYRHLIVACGPTEHRISSNSHFKYELVESLQLPDNTVCFIGDVIIPHNYFNVDGKFNRLYVRQYNDLNSTVLDIAIVISSTNHTISTLVEGIQSALNLSFGAHNLTVTFDSRKLSLTISENTGKTVKLFTDQELQSVNSGGWTGTLAYGDLRTIKIPNEIILFVQETI